MQWNGHSPDPVDVDDDVLLVEPHLRGFHVHPLLARAVFEPDLPAYTVGEEIWNIGKNA